MFTWRNFCLILSFAISMTNSVIQIMVSVIFSIQSHFHNRTHTDALIYFVVWSILYRSTSTHRTFSLENRFEHHHNNKTRWRRHSRWHLTLVELQFSSKKPTTPQFKTSMKNWSKSWGISKFYLNSVELFTCPPNKLVLLTAKCKQNKSESRQRRSQSQRNCQFQNSRRYFPSFIHSDIV